MNSEIEGYLDQLLAIRQDAPGIAAGLSDDQFRWQPEAHRWSIGECFDHLNKSAQLFMIAFDRSLAEGRSRNLTGTGPFVYPAWERLLVQQMEPPARMRFRARPSFVPENDLQPADIMRQFFEWQDHFAKRLTLADGLDLRRVRTRSPVVAWLTYSLGTAFRMFLSHERRHLAQARDVRNDRRFP